MKNNKVSLLDRDQITSRLYDEENDAQRVILVGSDMSGLADTIKSSLEASLSNMKVDLATPAAPAQREIQIVEIPVVVKEIEIREIEKPIVVEKPQVITVERPVITTKTEIVQVEKPVVVTEHKIIELEKHIIDAGLLKALLVVQTVSLLAIALIVLLK